MEERKDGEEEEEEGEAGNLGLTGWPLTNRKSDPLCAFLGTTQSRRCNPLPSLSQSVLCLSSSHP